MHSNDHEAGDEQDRNCRDHDKGNDLTWVYEQFQSPGLLVLVVAHDVELTVRDDRSEHLYLVKFVVNRIPHVEGF